MKSLRPDHVRPRDRSWWWQLAVAMLVAPFYVGLYLITLIGGAFDRREPRTTMDMPPHDAPGRLARRVILAGFACLALAVLGMLALGVSLLRS